MKRSRKTTFSRQGSVIQRQHEWTYRTNSYRRSPGSPVRSLKLRLILKRTNTTYDVGQKARNKILVGPEHWFIPFVIGRSLFFCGILKLKVPMSYQKVQRYSNDACTPSLLKLSMVWWPSKKFWQLWILHHWDLVKTSLEKISITLIQR